jgi:hypothetical protein
MVVQHLPAMRSSNGLIIRRSLTNLDRTLPTLRKDDDVAVERHGVAELGRRERRDWKGPS